MRLLALMLTLSAAAAGCLAGAPAEPDAAAADAPALSAALPSQQKLVLRTAEAEPDPLADLLGTPREIRRVVEVPADVSLLQLALDVRPALAEGAPSDEVTVRLYAPDGTVAHETPTRTTGGKEIATLEAPAPGRHELAASFRGAWIVGAVLVHVPEGYTPGHVVSVSHPEQTEVDHTFHPARVEVAAGAPARITLYDYDPHEGVENLQHNLAIPSLGARTEGRTTWGEVRVLDFVAPSRPGEHEFHCEYHPDMLKGVLVVT